MSLIHSRLIWNAHAEFSLTPNIYYLIRIHDIFSGVINTIKTKNNCFKPLSTNSEVQCSWFSRLVKMTLKIKTAHISIFKSRFRKVLWQPFIGKLKMVMWNSFDTDCKNEWTIFTRLISLTGPLTLTGIAIVKGQLSDLSNVSTTKQKTTTHRNSVQCNSRSQRCKILKSKHTHPSLFLFCISK